MKYISSIYSLFQSFCLIIAFQACSDENDPKSPVIPEPQPPISYADGFNYDVERLEADKSVTITFKAPQGSALYGEKDDIYLFSGVNSNWEGAPGKWIDNNAKYKMTAVKGEKNTWSITFPSSIRSYYGISDATPVQLLNLIVRNASGNKQTGDYAILVEDNKNNFYLKEPEIKPSPVSGDHMAGIHVHSLSSATLVLYDRDTKGNRKEYAYVVGSFSDWKLNSDYLMNYDDLNHCWWITIEDLSDTEIPFQYVVCNSQYGAIYLCDPYSEKVLEKNVNANFPPQAGGNYVSVLTTKSEDYNWEIETFDASGATASPVVYELLLRDFTNEHNLKGAKDKLPYLKALGVNVIELMPVQEFDGASSWGYNPAFYFALDNTYGTQREYKEFIDACHQEGIAVIFDVVYNHTTNNNPFSKLYWDPYRNRPANTNPWLNVETPHQKYVFTPNDFNHQSELTRNFVKRNLKYLMDTYKVDGFRFDFTKGFTQKRTTGDADLMAADLDRMNVLKEYYDAVKAINNDAFVIMEHFCPTEEPTLASHGITFWRNMNNAYCQSAMGYSSDSSFENLYESNFTSHFIGYMESHDEERMAYKQIQYGVGTITTNLATRVKQLKTNTTFFLIVPGPKMIWQFGELGYDFSINSNETGTAINESYRTDRKPIRWDYYDDESRKNLYDWYSVLINLRNNNQELFDGTASFEWKVNTTDWNNGRWIVLTSITGKKMVALGNFTNIDITIDFPESSGIWKNIESGTEESINTLVNLPAHNFVLYTNF